MSMITEKREQADSYFRRTIEFIPNAGQFDPQVRFISQAKGYRIFFLDDKIVFDFLSSFQNSEDVSAAAVVLQFKGRHPTALPKGRQLKEGVFNFYLGDDSARWCENIHPFSELIYANLWPNIDLRLRGDKGELKFDWIIRPGGDPAQIAMHYDGVDSVDLDSDGNLLINHILGVMTDMRPLAQQETESQTNAIDCSFVLHEGTVGFRVGSYDPACELMIDPAVSYTTYLGGSGADFIRGVTVDEEGCAYFVGQTFSANFPTTAGVYQPALAGTANAFISKITPDGTSLVYSTYLGGSGTDNGIAIAVDASGAAYVTGATTSADFPTVAPYQGALAGTQDAFVTKLTPNAGALTYSTYLGGAAGSTTGSGISVNIFGQTFIAGQTSSASFPTTGGAFSTTYNGGANDGFVSLLSSGGSIILVSTYLGGSGSDIINDMALDSSDFVYVTGSTDSADFPTTTGAYQTSIAGGMDAFVTKLSEDLSTLVYSTYLGGSGSDNSRSISLDSAYNACVTGSTNSADFPITAGAYQTTIAGLNDVFITKFSLDGGSLIFSTYLGGSADEGGAAIALDATGHVWVAGSTSSADFPTTPSVISSSFSGIVDWFISMLSADGTMLLASYFLGGTSQDYALGIAVNGDGAVFVVGQTDSNDFPVTIGAFQTVYAGTTDGAATKAYFATFGKASLTILELLG